MRFLNKLFRVITTTKNFYRSILIYLGRSCRSVYAKLFNGDIIRISYFKRKCTGVFNMLKRFKYAYPLRDFKVLRLLDGLLNTLNSNRLSILDLGCGNGETAMRLIYKSRLRAKSVYVVGLDINLHKLYQAKKILDDVVLGDAVYLPFRPKSFDLILMIEVLDHLPKPAGVYLLTKELNKLSKGAIIITCPNGSTPTSVKELCVWDRHNSDWRPEELRYFGYNIIGNVPKSLVLIATRIKLRKPFLILQLLLPILALVSLPPQISWQLMAWKIAQK